MKGTAFKKIRGFTLVELLIVIALLGILAAAVLSAINPLEQANRARDARLKNDSEQLISGIDRYFVITGEMPWVDDQGATEPAPELTWFSASDAQVGVCAKAPVGCSGDGDLILADELKSEFKNRDFITTTVEANELWMAKGARPSDSVYACFVPSSNAERKNWQDLLQIGGGNLPPTGGIPASGVPDSCPAEPDWQTSYCYACLPD